ncbi:MAG: TolC family protein [Deltaproteobacteria bacterium]|nr:TolC family protein [Deltaproteobacteria bacterium]
MIHKSVVWTVVIAGLAFVAGGWASADESAPPIEELVAAALANSPMIAAQRARLGAALEFVSPAGALEDPMLETGGAFAVMDGEPEFSTATLELSQEIPLGGQRGMRRDAASADADARRVALVRTEREIAMNVRMAYAELYELDREIAYLAAAREHLKLISAAAAARYAAGESDQEALLKAQIAVSRLMERQAELDSERAVLVAEMNRLLDRSGDAPLGTVAGLPEIEWPAWADESVAPTTPDVREREAGIEASEHRRDAAKKDLWPDLIVGVGGGVERNWVDGGQMPMGMARLGITLPIWQAARQRPMIRAAEQERAMAAAEKRDAEATARSALTRLRAGWQKTNRQVTLFREAIVPQTHAALDAARAAYLAGRGDFSMVVEDFNMWLDARVELAGREAERYRIWSELDALRPMDAGGK